MWGGWCFCWNGSIWLLKMLVADTDSCQFLIFLVAHWYRFLLCCTFKGFLPLNVSDPGVPNHWWTCFFFVSQVATFPLRQLFRALRWSPWVTTCALAWRGIKSYANCDVQVHCYLFVCIYIYIYIYTCIYIYIYIYISIEPFVVF